MGMSVNSDSTENGEEPSSRLNMLVVNHERLAGEFFLKVLSDLCKVVDLLVDEENVRHRNVRP